MSWPVRIWLVGFTAAVNLALGACSSSWPSRVTAQTDQRFTERAMVVRTVDVLPMDVQLWTYPGNTESPDALQEQLTVSTRGSIEAAMATRGYRVESHIGWAGDYVAPSGEHRSAMSADALAATMYSMSGYGQAMASADQGLLVPFLPARLGASTGSDATLYVGGWSYVGEDSESSTGGKVAKGILIGALIAIVIIIVIIAAREGGGGGGGVASGVGKAAASAGKVAVKATATLARAAGKMTGDVLLDVARAGADVTEGLVRGGDAFGHSSTHIDFYYDRPDYYAQPTSPKKGKSQTYLEMTLVDNHTGQVLWHARQRFPASARKPAQIQRAVTNMLATLPTGG